MESSQWGGIFFKFNHNTQRIGLFLKEMTRNYGIPIQNCDDLIKDCSELCEEHIEIIWKNKKINITFK